MTCTMANTWNAQSIQFLTQPEPKPLLSVMTSKRDQALWWLAYHHGVHWGLARLFDACLHLRLTAYAACIPTHDMTPQRLPLLGESHRSVQSRVHEGPEFGRLPSP